MAESIEKSVAIKSAWMILEGLGFDRARNSDLERTVLAVFESAPAADGVKVVRCSKCKHWKQRDNREYGFCVKHRGIWLNSDFCSKGERKDGGQDDG